MLNVIYVGLVLSNAISSNLGPTSAYLYSARLQYTGEWQVQCYDRYDDGRVYYIIQSDSDSCILGIPCNGYAV